jgi:NADH-quinone oxidoreductase subunit N
MPPAIEYLLLAPIIAVFGAALLGIGVEALVVRRLRFPVQVGQAGIAIAVALIFTVRNWMSGDSRSIAAMGAVAIDGPAMAAWLLLLLGAGGVLVVAAERASNGGVSAFTGQATATPDSPEEEAAESAGVEHTEVFPLFLFALGGMLVLASASNLLTVFVGLEAMSLPLYLLVGLARRNRMLSHEAALKYFLLGATGSAVFLYGVALLFGYAGSFDYAAIVDAITTPRNSDTLVYAGLALAAVGLLFKLGVFPFHAWVPDVYTGAPTAITAYLASCGKVAAVYALLRLLFVPLGALRWTWQLPLAVVALASIAYGAIAGLTQHNVKRLLAYSGIVHAGFMLMPIAVASTAHTGELVSDFGSAGALLFYLLTYLPPTLGAFALTLWVRDDSGPNPELSGWRGLAHRSPFLALAMGVFMLSLIGLPGTGGFVSKLITLVLAWRNDMAWLALGGLACSLLAAGFYLRVIRIMFMETPPQFGPPVPRSKPLAALVMLCLAVTVYLGVFPASVGDMIADMTELLR